MTESYLTPREAASVLGLHYRRVQIWIRDGVITPSRIGGGRGHGNRSVLTTMDVLAIDIARELRHRQYALDDAGEICSWLMGLTHAGLREMLSMDYVMLLAVGGKPLNRQRLLTRAEVSAVDLMATLDTAVPVALVDVGACYERLAAKLEALRAQEAAPR